MEVRGGGHGAPTRASRDCIRPGCSADQVPVLGYYWPPPEGTETTRPAKLYAGPSWEPLED